MRHQASMELFDYWAKLSGDQAAPLRTQIDPVVLRRVLPHLFIITADETEDLVFRLAGTRVCDLFGGELRGMPFTKVWSGTEAARVEDICQRAIGEETPFRLDVLSEEATNQKRFEMLLLPLRPATGSSDRLLGSLVPQSPAAVHLAPAIAGLVLEACSSLDKTGAGTNLDNPASPLRGSGLRRLLGLASFGSSRTV